MKRFPRAFATVAISLAALLPLEQSHCAWMGLQAQARGVPSDATSHACCSGSEAKEPVTSAPAPPAPPECACLNLPGGSLPAAPISTEAAASVSIVLAAEVGVPVPSPAEVPAPALDVGDPPSLVELGAHGQRAPPFSS